MRICNLAQFHERRTLPEQVYADNPARLGADECLDRTRVNQQRLGVDVREPRYAAQECDTFRRRDERKVGDDDLVAGVHSEGD